MPVANAQALWTALLLQAGPLALVTLFAIRPAQAEVLYRFEEGVLFDGRFGPIAHVQAKIGTALAACGKPKLDADGKFGLNMRTSLQTLAKCPDFAAKLTADADARAGALTTSFWAALMNETAPSVDDRARTIMLTYEATDYTRQEWNFCQSRPLYNPAAGQSVCFSNDPHSYITWGPNGATAGGGREAQLILSSVDGLLPALIDQSFGPEAGAVRRMSHLRDRNPARSVETFLCGIWNDTRRRAAWKTGFDAIGRVPAVRAAYDMLYRSTSLDGGKIATFFRAYRENGLVPTEIDYAFFKDRAAHTSPVLSSIQQAIGSALSREPSLPRWKVRQAIALNVRPGSQRVDRLGRDVAFYIDGAGTSLGPEEMAAWRMRGRLRASDAGLSDARNYAAFTPGPAIDTVIDNPATLTGAERAACPQAVLNTRRP